MGIKAPYPPSPYPPKAPYDFTGIATEKASFVGSIAGLLRGG